MPVRKRFNEYQRRVLVIGFIILCAAGILLAKLYDVQVKEGGKYSEALRTQTRVEVVIPPARGSILDRNSIPLAENRASFDIDVYLRELMGYYARGHKGSLPKIEIEVGRGSNRRTRKEIDIAKIVNESAADIFKTLNVKPAYTDTEVRRHYNEKPNIRFTLVRGLNEQALAQFCEKNFQIPGIELTARPVRHYPYGALAPHILGYLGHLSKQTDAEYEPEFIGKEGIEKSFDSFLQGQPGKKVLIKNNLGFVLQEEGRQEPRAGQYVYLTVDARIQWIVEQAMRKVGRGAAVVMDVNNGDILAMVSVPNFDPSAFVPTVPQKTWSRLTRDGTKPLFNRAISPYAAGSIYKPYVALAALETGAITPSTIIDSPGAIWMANRWWKDWSPNGQGPISLRQAMAMSCNTYFYQIGVKAGIDSIVGIGERMGFGQLALNTTDQEILSGEAAGVLPGPRWMQAKGEQRMAQWRAQVEAAKKTGQRPPRPPIIERWSIGHTLNTSIGQGYVAVTPLQMAVAISTIANGGKIYYPRLVLGVGQEKQVTQNGQEGDEAIEKVKEFPIREHGSLHINPQTLAAVRESLLAVVDEGTGRQAGVQGYKVAGKTGTAQFFTRLEGRRVRDLRAWFTGFGPYEDPRYAVVVVVEGGTSGGSTAAPIVSDIFENIFAMERALATGTPIQMTYLTPSVGHFGGVRESQEADPGGLFGTPPEQLAPEVGPDEPRESRGSGTSSGRIRGARGLR